MRNSLYVGTALVQLLCLPAAYAQSVQDAEEIQGAGNPVIVVTATRREQSLQDVPVSVTALTSDDLAQSAVTSTFELGRSVPGLNITRANTSVQPTLRGVGTRSAAPGDEANVAIYLDGVYQPSMSAANFNLLNVQRVEVLRGPQGTLFGRNSTGGLINVITTEPGRDFEFRAEASYGSFSDRSAQAYLSTPLGPNVGANVTVLWGESDGYLRDISRGGQRTSGREDFAIRGKLLVEPGDATEFKLTLGYIQSRDPSGYNTAPFKGNTVARSLANNPNVILPTNPWKVAPTVVPDAELEQTSAAFETRFDLGGVSLETTSSYQRNIAGGTVDSDGTPVFTAFASSSKTENSRYYTNEIRLLSRNPGAVQWIIGGFHFDGRGQFDPVVSATPTATVRIFADQRTESWAAFAEGTYEVTPELSVTGGLRYTSERRKYDGRTLVNSNVSSQVSNAGSKFNQWTYRAAVQYEFDPTVSVYASYSRGFKSGVFNTFSTAPSSAATRPEVLDAFEAGIKSDPLRWLRINLSAFHYDYRDIQLSARDPNTGLVLLLNAANARVNGAELEVSASPSDSFNIRAFATVLDGEYTNFPGAQTYTPIYQNQTAIGGSAQTPIGNAAAITDESGSQMIRAPKYTFGINGNYTMRTEVGDIMLSGSLYRSGRFFWDVNNTLEQPAYTLANAELGWTSQNGHYGVSFWVRNLTNEVTYQSLVGTARADLVTYNPPRMFGGTLKVNF